MDIVSSIVRFMRQEVDLRRTRKSLHELDDRILQDIGVRRDEINSLTLQLRDNARAQAAAEAQNRRNDKAHKRGLGGGGFAAQH